MGFRTNLIGLAPPRRDVSRGVPLPRTRAETAFWGTVFNADLVRID